MSGCNPYEEVFPVASKGSLVEPKETFGGVWKIGLAPGTDNSFIQGHSAPSCFGPDAKRDYLRQLDFLKCLDGRKFSSVISAKIRENVMSLFADKTLEAWLSRGSSMELLDEISHLEILIRILTGVHCLDVLEIIQISYIFPEALGKIIDRTWLELYTKEEDGLGLGDETSLEGIKRLFSRIKLYSEILLGYGYNQGGYNIGGYM